MYISRLPILLNQVQAIVALPFLRPFGIWNPNVLTHSPVLPGAQCGPSGRPSPSAPCVGTLPTALVGQPPMMVWMTLHFDLSAGGGKSYVTLSWQEPPPWTAEPVKLRSWSVPAAIGLLTPVESKASALPPLWHGNLKFCPFKGLVWSVWKPYGRGVFMMTWPLTESARPRTAAVEDVKSILTVVGDE